MLVVAGLLAGALSPLDVDRAPGPVVLAKRDRPDVVVFLTDDQRLESLATMPRVQRLLVDKGVRFSHAMVPTALCCPSRSSILTGLYSHHTRVFGNGDVGGSRFGGWAQFHRRGLEFRTIAVALQRAGYRTGFFGKYLNDFSDFAPEDYRPPGWDEFTAFKYSRGAYFGYRLTDGTYHGDRAQDYSTDVLARRASDFVTATPEQRPLFVMFSPYGPHSPYVAAPRHATATVAVPHVGGVAPQADVLPDPETTFGRDDGRTLGPDPLWAARRQRHLVGEPGEVAVGQTRSLLAVDDAVAALVRTLQRTGRLRDTLILFMSDNGYLWGEHGLVGKDVPYAPAVRVPMVLRWDGRVPAGRVDRRLALNVDVAGTIAAAAGVRMRTDGLDLLGTRTRRGFPLEAMAGYRGRPAYCGWRTRSRMYVRWATGREELYDYRSDPHEQHNLAGDPSLRDVQQRMQGHAVRVCSPEPPGFDW